MIERCDVLIVGGGPAGSSLAYGLAGSGLDVVVWDKSRFPRDKVCAGWITPQILHELAVSPADYARGRVLQPIRGFRFGRIGSAEVEIAYDAVVSYGILRRELDHYLLERSGARFRLGEPVRSIEQSSDGWTVNGALHARLLVGAGGHFCPVARRLATGAGGAGTHEPVVVARELELEMTPEQQQRCPVRPEVPELFFVPDLRGYGWIFRKGRFLNVGLGRQDPRGFPEHLERFLEHLTERGRIPADLPRDLRGHAYLLYDQAPRPLAVDGALLVGDAAGLAYAKSGEGIRPAIESGLLASRAIRDAQGRFELGRLLDYSRQMIARFGARDTGGDGVSRWLPLRLRGPVAGTLLARPWFARRVVMDRWFLHVGQPPLDPPSVAPHPPLAEAPSAG